MGLQDAFDRVMASLNDAMLNDAQWPHTSALIDEACGTTGNAVVVSEGFGENARIHFRAPYHRGRRHEEREEDYFRNYHHRDECVPRLWRLPDGRLAHVSELYTDQEKKTSPAYNEIKVRLGARNGVAVRLDGPDGTRVTCSFADPSQPGGWETQQIDMIERLIPHLRQFVRVRQALAAAQALETSLGGLLDNDRMGVIQLDRDGRILEANNRALDILRRGDGLCDRNGKLETWLPADNAGLQNLLAGALPPLGGQGVAGTATVRRLGGACKLLLHVNPVEAPALDFGVRRVAALLLVVDPGRQAGFDGDLVAKAFGLTTAETEVAVMLSEGRTPRVIAALTGRRPGTVYNLIKLTYRKLGVSRQADLVRLLWPLSDVSVRPALK